MAAYPNPFQSWSSRSNTNVPSVFGALPSLSSSDSMGASLVERYHIMCYSLNIMNCDVLGANSQPCFHIVTDTANPYTTIKDAQNRTIALIAWGDHPVIEIKSVIPRQEIKNWLKLSRDGSCRYMEVRGTRYTWGTKNGYVCLYTGPENSPNFLVKIDRSKYSITLDVSRQVLQAGLLDACVIAAFLLQCGLNID